jgi:methyl-accepting chemotaxis protein
MNFIAVRAFINRSIARRLIFFILGAVVLMNIAMMIFIVQRSSKDANSFARNYSVSLSQGVANNVKVYMEQALETTNTMANTLLALRFAEGVTREAIEMIFINVLTGNDEYLAVWTMWEPNAFEGRDDYYVDDPLYEESGGQFSLSYYLDKGSVAINWGTLEDYNQSFYQIPRQRMAKTIMNPYSRNYTQNEADNIYVTSVITPIIVDGEFQGVVGLDINMERMHALIENVTLFESGSAAILSNDLQVAAHKEKFYIGRQFRQLVDENYTEIESAVNENRLYLFEDRSDNPLLRTFTPVEFADIPEAWSIAAEIPLYEIAAESRKLRTIIILIGLAGVLVISLVVFLMAKDITYPILKINLLVKEAARGKLDAEVGFDNRADEVGLIAKELKNLIDGLKKTAIFARKIGDGNYDETHSKLSEDDELGEALLHMQLSLKKAKEEELKRKEEDNIRSWTTQGQALFADLARNNSDNVSELAFLIISNLVKYLNANQGGLFLINDEKPEDVFIELAACYAYDRRKFMEKRINIGEGLVGSCYREKKFIYMEEVPESYLRITSGLGDNNPRSLLIVPLKVNDEIFGVIELASFECFKPYEIEFTEKVGEIIASAISNLKTAANTRILLGKSQQQAEEMRAQEEEMRQNVEELSATQEAMAEKEKESQQKIKELIAKIEQLTRNKEN